MFFYLPGDEEKKFLAWQIKLVRHYHFIPCKHLFPTILQAVQKHHLQNSLRNIFQRYIAITSLYKF